jgi:hypothetical protein
VGFRIKEPKGLGGVRSTMSLTMQWIVISLQSVV